MSQESLPPIPPFVVSRALGAALFGVDALVVEVQVARLGGAPRTAVIGNAENEVKEARERVKAALQAADLWSRGGEQSFIINLAPADAPKNGTGLDLPMCLGVAALELPLLREALRGVLAYAEVGLDGRLRRARGTLSAAMAARARGLSAVLVAPEAAREAAEVEGLKVLAARTLRHAVALLRGDASAAAPWPEVPPPPPADPHDLSDVKGQRAARRALEVAAAGGHNLLLVGPPGSGKTLLARRMPSILPELTRDEALQVTRVHSAAGLMPAGVGLVRTRPFRAPHHGVSSAGLVGGGSPPRPGEIALAGHGVLFLDELLEFPRAVLDALRQPLEDGEITVVRALGRARFPSRFLFVGAMNPCPCGWFGAPRCHCTTPVVARYRSRLSGPLLDRIDIHIEVPPVVAADLASFAPGESSAVVRARVVAARARQEQRNARFGKTWNAHLAPRDLAEACPLTPAARQQLESAMRRLELSARAHDRILKVSRTLADLVPQDDIDAPQVAEAVAYRALDRPLKE